jgi:ParB family transcriptional regulator, chromosome partitioning protein
MPRKTTSSSSAPKTPRKRATKKAADAGSVGIAATAVLEGDVPPAVAALAARVAERGGTALATYRDPFGGAWLVFAILPLTAVEPTPYQRELSPTHANRLATVIPKIGRFLDPIIAIEHDAGYWTPNGMHRLTALRQLGGQSIAALIVPEREIAFRILALNTEKAHVLKDKALEVIRMARALAADPATQDKPEATWAFEFEEPAYLTIGAAYEKNGRFSGGAYQPVVKRCEAFSDEPIAETIAFREARAARLLELDEAISAAVTRLKEAGFVSGYLKPLVVARVNPLRFVKVVKGQEAKRPDFDATIDKMITGAEKLDASKIKPADLAAAAAMGGSGDED